MRPTRMTRLRVLVLSMLSAVAGNAPAGLPIEITQKTLPGVLRDLRDRNTNASFVVNGVVELPGYLTGSTDAWYVRDLTIRSGGVLYLGTGDLDLYVKGTIRCEAKDAAIASFRPERLTAAAGKDGDHGGGNQPSQPGTQSGPSAPAGQPGTPGENGLSSGNLRLFLTKPPSGVLRIALLGQSGGRGGNGGGGGPGIPGNRGRPGESGPFGCMRGGESGSAGGPGGAGGNAGLGGQCGHGGTVTLSTPARFPAVESFLEIDSRPATVGDPGTPGRGGDGGRGGEGGSGSGFCGGGSPGAPGPHGPAGIVPPEQRSRPCDPPRLEVPVAGVRKR